MSAESLAASAALASMTVPTIHAMSSLCQFVSGARRSAGRKRPVRMPRVRPASIPNASAIRMAPMNLPALSALRAIALLANEV
jgi:hypothetical protein